MAAITTENAHMIGPEPLAWMQPGANLLLLSRASAADFPALAAAPPKGGSGGDRRFPVEPLPKDDPIRRVPNMLFSPTAPAR